MSHNIVNPKMEDFIDGEGYTDLLHLLGGTFLIVDEANAHFIYLPH